MSIRLEKKGDSHRIDLSKLDANVKEEMIINLNWTQPEKKSGWAKIFSGNNEVDLDLGCWYELRDGAKSCIDGVQFARGRGGRRDQVTVQGSYVAKPWIWHTGDDRTGSMSTGESILVNPHGLADIKRMTIYCFIYDGVAKWDQTDAVVTIKVPGNPDIIVEMGKEKASKMFSAIAEISFGDDKSMTVKKLITFHNGHPDCDKAYNWGMKWSQGGK